MRRMRAEPHGTVFPPEPCVGCGTPTIARAITSVRYVGHDHHDDVERVAWCAGCEAKRNRAQDAAVAANAAVLPHLRAEAQARLAGVLA